MKARVVTRGEWYALATNEIYPIITLYWTTPCPKRPAGGWSRSTATAFDSIEQALEEARKEGFEVSGIERNALVKKIKDEADQIVKLGDKINTMQLMLNASHLQLTTENQILSIDAGPFREEINRLIQRELEACLSWLEQLMEKHK